MVELPERIEQQIEEVWFRSQKKLINEKIQAIQEVLDGGFTVREVVDKVEDFNSVANTICGDDEQLYDMYRFRMFTRDCEVALIQRPKIISEEGKLFSVNGQFYDLSDYDEVDVDVRRYGEGTEAD